MYICSQCSVKRRNITRESEKGKCGRGRERRGGEEERMEEKKRNIFSLWSIFLKADINQNSVASFGISLEFCRLWYSTPPRRPIPLEKMG